VHTLRHTTLETFASTTAWLNRPPTLPRRTIRVTTVGGLARAVRRARAGQTIVVRGPMQIPGEFRGFDRVVRGGLVRVVLGPGVAFTGGKGQNLPAVLLRDSGGWRIWGGRITNPDGDPRVRDARRRDVDRVHRARHGRHVRVRLPRRREHL